MAGQELEDSTLATDPSNWMAANKVEFILQVSHFSEGDRKAINQHLRRLIAGNWTSKVESALLLHMNSKHTVPYLVTLGGDLLLFLKDLWEDTQKKQELFGGDISRYWTWIDAKWPGLLLATYGYALLRCQGEAHLKKYLPLNASAYEQYPFMVTAKRVERQAEIANQAMAVSKQQQQQHQAPPL